MTGSALTKRHRDRSGAALRGFAAGAITGLVLFGLYLAFGLADEFGWGIAILVTLALSAALGLVWALVFAVRHGRSHIPWSWTRLSAAIHVRTAEGEELLTVTADTVRGRRRAHEVETLMWDQIERGEIHAERDVMGPYGKSFWREIWSSLLPVEVHQPLSLRWTVKGQAFQRNWVLSDGSAETTPEDAARLTSLVTSMTQAGSRERRASALAAWSDETSLRQ